MVVEEIPEDKSELNRQDSFSANDDQSNELTDEPVFENDDGAAKKLTFKRSATIIAVMVIGYQFTALFLALAYGVSLFVASENEPSYSFYIINDLLGIVWFFLFLGVVLNDIYRHNIAPSSLFNWDFRILSQQIPRVLLYFIPCALFVGLTSALSTETELEFADGDPLVVSLAFLSAVILAPIIEELIFRGYLQTSMLDEFKRPRERIVVNGMLFAAAHMFILAAMFSTFPYYIFLLGFLFAKLYEETRSVLPGILLHGLNNLLVFGIDVYKFLYLQDSASDIL
ncbi:MAG: lysostaphin resistance A-like protein [Calditrichia bacterium]